MTDTEADGSTSRSGSSKKNIAFPKKNPALHSSNAQDKIDELSEGINVLSKRLSRRQALSTGVGVAAGVVGGLVIGGAAGYFGRGSSTTTVSSPPVTQTITSTSTVSTSLSNTLSSTSSITSTGGPGIDYYYDPTLSGLTVNYVAGAAVEHTIIDPTFSLFTKETGIKVTEDLTTACVGTIGDTMFAAGSNEYDVLDAGALAGIAYGWWKSNYIVPWANFFDLNPPGWDATDILPVLTSTCSTFPSDDPPNALLCLPLNLAINCMYYNVADWTAAGLSGPLPGTIGLDGPTSGSPALYSDVFPIAQKVQTNNAGKYAYAVRDDNWFGNFAYGQTNGPWLFGQNWLSSDFTCQFTNQDVSDGWNQWLADTQMTTPDPVSMTDMEIGADGEAGTLLGMQWTLNAFPGLYGSGSAVTPATMAACLPPMVNNSATFMAGQSPVINAFSSAQQQKAAWSLCSFISSPRMQAVYNSMGTTGYRPSIISSAAAKTAAQGNYSLQYGLAAGLTLLNGGVLGSGNAGSNNVYASEPLPRNAQAFTIATTIGNELAKVQAGTETMATCLNNLDSSVDALLKTAGVYGTSYPLGTSG